MLLAVFQVRLNLKAAIEGLALLGQFPDQDVIPEVDVFRGTVEDEVIRDRLEFLNESHALYLAIVRRAPCAVQPCHPRRVSGRPPCRDWGWTYHHPHQSRQREPAPGPRP